MDFVYLDPSIRSVLERIAVALERLVEQNQTYQNHMMDLQPSSDMEELIRLQIQHAKEHLGIKEDEPNEIN